MIRNIHHIGITVRDFERALAFYQEAFGFKVLGSELQISKEQSDQISSPDADRDVRVVMMQAGNCYLEIMGNPKARAGEGAGPSGGYVQLCIDVDDIDAEFVRLKELGVTFGPVAPVDFGHVKAITGTDPEGNVIELVQTIHDWDCNMANLLPARA